MTPPSLPRDENERLNALKRYRILDTPPEQILDDLVALAAQVCGTPNAFLSLIDEDRQWFKAKVGLDLSETPRDISFCGHAIGGTELFIVPDATKDERFADNPLVTAPPHVRFYAGAPLITPDGYALGALCITDHQPRNLDEAQQGSLRKLARQAVSQLELRRQSFQIQENEHLINGQQHILELIAANEPLPLVLTELTQLIEHHAPDAICSILILDPDGIHLRHGAAPRLPKAYTQAIDGVAIGENVGSCGTAAHRGEAVYVADIATDRQWQDYRKLALSHGLAACWSTPILDKQDQVLGTFAIYYSESCLPQESHLHLIKIATHTAAIAITSHRSEEELRQKHALLEAVMTGASDAIFIKDLEGRYQIINPAGARFLNHTPEEIIGKTDNELLPPEAASSFRLSDQNVIIHGKPTSREDVFDNNGKPLIFLANKTPWKSADGKVIGVIGVSRDITARKQAEIAIRKSESRFRALFDYAPDGIIITDTDGNYLDSNESMCQMLGYPREELLRHRINDHLVEISTSQIASLFDPSQERIRELKFQRQDGSRFDAEVRITRLPGGNRIAIIRDTTERTIMEEALRHQKAILQETGQIAHVGGWEFDPITGKGTWTSEVARIHDLDPTQETSMEDGLTYYRGESRQKIEYAVKKAIENGTPYDLKLELHTAKGNRKWVRTIGRPIMEDGRVVKVRGFFQDITDLKQANDRVRHLNRVYAILSGINQVIVRERDNQTLLSETCRVAVEKGRFRLAWISMFDSSGQHLALSACSEFNNAPPRNLRTLLTAMDEDRAASLASSPPEN